jgi:cellulose synthase/poly-beta-1,6-N-acetylglucosamine synthase-like glycosyltransferase
MTLVSVVVIGRNEGARLERCLRSVNAMAHEGFTTEVLYVDSGSTDDSLALAERLGVRTVSLQSARPTAALGRNAGWRAARGEIVLFLDGDTLLHPGFVRTALPRFSAPAVAVLWGHRRELFPRASLYNRVLDLDWVYAPGLTQFCGGDALFRRAILEQTGGFDETLIAGEEPELCRRILALGGEILHLDLPMTGHDLAMTRFAQYWKRATRAGHAFAEVSARFRHTANPLWEADARRNRVRALTLLSLPLAALILSAALRSPWPLGGVVALLAALALRTAWKARWKSRDKLALALYGIHSHFQQVPIYLGQLQFHRSQRTGKRTALVEYKG